MPLSIVSYYLSNIYAQLIVYLHCIVHYAIIRLPGF
jgi:hypothetical protein